MINHIKRWWYWQKRNGNSFFYKILVLFRIANSPTFNQIWTPDEAKAFHDGFMKGLNSYKEDKMFEADEMEGCHSCKYGENFDTDKEPCKYCYGLSKYTKKVNACSECEFFNDSRYYADNSILVSWGSCMKCQRNMTTTNPYQETPTWCPLKGDNDEQNITNC